MNGRFQSIAAAASAAGLVSCPKRARSIIGVSHARNPSLVALCSLGVALILGGCQANAQTPAGQVVATVDGVDVTQSEVSAELQASQLPAGADEKLAARAVLQRLINRKLLAEVARERGWSDTREYLIARQRAEEDALAQLALRQLTGNSSVPSPGQIDKFIAENPGLFANRTIYVLDQIRFAQPRDVRDLRYLEAATTLDDVAARLKQNATRFDRAPATLDSATLETGVATRLDKLPAGEVFVVTTGATVLASVVKERQAAPIADDIAREYARLMLERRRSEEAVKSRLEELRRHAKIAYQPGYSPEAPSARAAQPARAPS